jgi:hypothetical protein
MTARFYSKTCQSGRAKIQYPQRRPNAPTFKKLEG